MGVGEVKKYFKDKGLNYEVLEFEASTATVELAAEALGVQPGLIAKTMAFKLKDEQKILLICAGDKRIDNRKFKKTFHSKGKMLSQEEVEDATGHPVGGVCPFGLRNELPVYLDVSLKAYDFVYPAAGSSNSAVKITPEDLEKITKGKWVEVSR
ncbi:MAG: YbaK/EbsC family protein [Desulfitobacteriia bacterium]